VAVEPAPKKVITTGVSTIPKPSRDIDRPKKVVQDKIKDEKISPVKKESGDKALQQKVKEM
jgi:hypothetical protein